MDNHKIVMIFIFFLLKKSMMKMLSFLFFRKYVWKTFRIWLHVYKQNILVFQNEILFFEFWRKPIIFNIGSISYNISL